MIPEIQALIVSFLPWEEIEQRELLLLHFPHVRAEWFKATKFDVKVNTENKITTITHTVNNKRHREDGPAFIKIWVNKFRKVEYYIDNKLHRKDGPAIIGMSTSGLRKEEYFINNKRHRIGGPAVITIYSNKSRKEEFWREDIKQ